MAALSARLGVCGDRDDSSGQIDIDREAAIAKVLEVVRNRMTPQLVAAINSPQGPEHLEFHLGKTLDNIARWFAPK